MSFLQAYEVTSNRDFAVNSAFTAIMKPSRKSQWLIARGKSADLIILPAVGFFHSLAIEP